MAQLPMIPPLRDFRLHVNALARSAMLKPITARPMNSMSERATPSHVEEGFVRTVALVIVAANVHRLGLILREKERRKMRWHAARKRAE